MSYSPLDYPATRAQELWEDQQQEEREAEARELALSVAEYLDRQHADAVDEYERTFDQRICSGVGLLRADGTPVEDDEVYAQQTREAERRMNALEDAMSILRERRERI